MQGSPTIDNHHMKIFSSTKPVLKEAFWGYFWSKCFFLSIWNPTTWERVERWSSLVTSSPRELEYGSLANKMSRRTGSVSPGNTIHTSTVSDDDFLPAFSRTWPFPITFDTLLHHFVTSTVVIFQFLKLFPIFFLCFCQAEIIWIIDPLCNSRGSSILYFETIGKKFWTSWQLSLRGRSTVLGVYRLWKWNSRFAVLSWTGLGKMHFAYLRFF